MFGSSEEMSVKSYKTLISQSPLQRETVEYVCICDLTELQKSYSNSD